MKMPDCSPIPAGASRKSVNWAPRFKPTTKRISSRCTSKPPVKEHTAFAKTPKGKVRFAKDSLGKAIARIYKSRRCKEQQRAPPAAQVKEAPEEQKPQPKPSADSKLRKRAFVGEGDGGKLDGNRTNSSQQGGRWISVPLTDMDNGDTSPRKSRRVNAADEVINDRRKSPRVSAAATQSSKRQCPEKETSKSSVAERTDIEAQISEMCTKLMKKDVAEIDDASIQKLQGMVTDLRGVVQQVESVVRKLQERKAERECAVRATVAAKAKKLRDEITKLKRYNQRVVTEKLRIQRERDALKKEHSCVRRLQVDMEEAKAHAAALSTKLSQEQDKSSCQICFNAPRDAIVLPCMHFQYCNKCLWKHQRKIKECPTCRCKISGVLRCNVSTS